MSKLTQILAQLQQGEDYAFSYTDKAAEAQLNITITYLKERSLYNIHTLESTAHGDSKQEYNKAVEETIAIPYIEDNLARNRSNNENLNPAAKRPK